MNPVDAELLRPTPRESDGEPYDAARLSWLERALHLFTDVRPGEGVTALVMFLNVFLILCAYYFVKSLRDGWIAVSNVAGFSSTEVKAYTSFAQTLVLIGAVALYARLATRWPRRELIARTTLFCIFNLFIFYFLHESEVPGIGVVFYIWVGMFGLFVVAQFWAFAADLYSDERGRRLMPMIAIGATAGAVAGSFVTEATVRSGILDSGALLLAATLPLVASIMLTAIADRRGPTGAGTHPTARARAAVPAAAADGKHVGAFKLVWQHHYLIAVAAITLLAHWVITNGDNLLFRTVQEALRNELAGRPGLDASAVQNFVRDGTTAFYGNYFFWVNLTALGLQAFLASRLIKYGGFGVILLFLPAVALLSYSAMALVPLLIVVRVMKTAEAASSYSINNTAQQILWLPATTEMKYKAKPAIETFFVRFGDGLAALTVLVGVRFLALSTPALFVFNIVLILVWLAIAVFVFREYERIRRGGTVQASGESPATAHVP